MRRIILLFTVAAMMAAMLVSAGPANAGVLIVGGNGSGFNSGGDVDVDGGGFDFDGGGFNFSSGSFGSGGFNISS